MRVTLKMDGNNLKTYEARTISFSGDEFTMIMLDGRVLDFPVKYLHSIVDEGCPPNRMPVYPVPLPCDIDDRGTPWLPKTWS